MIKRLRTVIRETKAPPRERVVVQRPARFSRSLIENATKPLSEVPPLAWFPCILGISAHSEVCPDDAAFARRNWCSMIVANYSATSQMPVALDQNPSVPRFSGPKSVSPRLPISSSDLNCRFLAGSVAHFPECQYTTPSAPRSNALLSVCLHPNTSRQ